MLNTTFTKKLIRFCFVCSFALYGMTAFGALIEGFTSGDVSRHAFEALLIGGCGFLCYLVFHDVESS